MIDLRINNAGDLVASKHEVLCTLKLPWTLTDNPTVKLCFKTGINAEEKQNTDNLAQPLKLFIDTSRNNEPLSIDSCYDEDELRQRVLIATRATKRIVCAKHKDITAEEVLTEIHDAVFEQIENLLDEPAVVIRKEHLDAHPFSWQNLNVYIYDGNKEIYNFKMEV